jgi:two-component SAPR family response regulator
MGKIYILDDNFAQRKIVQTACTELFKELQIFYELITVESIAKFYKELENLSIYSCDVFFIEINLNHYYNGINFAKKIKKRSFNTNIIFFTRNRQVYCAIVFYQKMQPKVQSFAATSFFLQYDLDNEFFNLKLSPLKLIMWA